jgi:hypothetical protein
VNEYQKACVSLANNVEGALLCGVIEAGSGKLLALHDATGSGPGVEQAFVQSCLELFRGPSAEVFGAEAPEQSGYAEIQLASAHTCHIAKGLGDGIRFLVLVARRDINVGIGWAETKATASGLARIDRR